MDPTIALASASSDEEMGFALAAPTYVTRGHVLSIGQVPDAYEVIVFEKCCTDTLAGGLIPFEVRGWTQRSAFGELNKERLEVILTDVRAGTGLVLRHRELKRAHPIWLRQRGRQSFGQVVGDVRPAFEKRDADVCECEELAHIR